jgi:hypothetical protein
MIEPAGSEPAMCAGPTDPANGETRRQPCRIVPFPQRDTRSGRGSAAEAARRTWTPETLRDVCVSGLAVWALILCAMALLA